MSFPIPIPWTCCETSVNTMLKDLCIFKIQTCLTFYCKYRTLLNLKRLLYVHDDEHKAPWKNTSKSIRWSKRKLELKNEVQLLKPHVRDQSNKVRSDKDFNWSIGLSKLLKCVTVSLLGCVVSAQRTGPTLLIDA